jgi:NAD(P)-dependent dehydrogenase (short-subunit alcohol dehydrogenase family)
MTEPIVIVTGAARGIGLATTKRFLVEGWKVAMLDINQPALLAAENNLGDGVKLYHCDISNPDQVRTSVDRIYGELGQIFALVNNAGVADFGPLLDTSFEDWRQIMATNLDGTFLMTQAVALLMAKHGKGAVVNIASISGLRASTLRVAYGTSKAAIAHLSLQQAAELGEFGIRVNTVAPGPVDTEMAKKVHSAEIRAAYHDAIPLNRYGLEEEIANAIYFLCSDQASYITGQAIAVDGGFDATGIGLPALRAESN